MPEAYIGHVYLVEGSRSCITLTKIEDTTKSIPDHVTKESKRIPQILTWINDSQVPMRWPLGTGIMTINGKNFNLDLLPEIEATECRISLCTKQWNDKEDCIKLVIHLEKCIVILGNTTEDSKTSDLLEQLA